MGLFSDYKKDMPKDERIHNFQEREIDGDLLEVWGSTASNTPEEYKTILQHNIDKGWMTKDAANEAYMRFKRAREMFGISCNIRHRQRQEAKQ